MDNTYTSVDLFEKYLDEALSIEEQLAFESKLKNNSEVADAFDFYKKMLVSLNYADKDELQNTIKEVSSSLDKDGFFLNEHSISDYVDGQMTKEEVNKLENRIKKDAAFAQKVEFEKKLQKSITSLDKEDLLKDISSIQSKLAAEGFYEEESQKEVAVTKKESTSARIIPIWRKYRAIAAVILFAFAIGLFWLLPSQQNNTQLYVDNFKKESQELYPLLEELGNVGMVDTDRNRKMSLFEALQLYEEEKNEAVIAAFNQHLSKFPEDTTATFYLGLSYMNQQKFIEAEKWLSPLINNASNPNALTVKWYLGLTYLMTKGKTEAAKNLLKDVATTNNIYQEAAIVILAELN